MKTHVTMIKNFDFKCNGNLSVRPGEWDDWVSRKWVWKEGQLGPKSREKMMVT